MLSCCWILPVLRKNTTFDIFHFPATCSRCEPWFLEEVNQARLTSSSDASWRRDRMLDSKGLKVLIIHFTLAVGTISSSGADSLIFLVFTGLHKEIRKVRFQQQWQDLILAFRLVTLSFLALQSPDLFDGIMRINIQNSSEFFRLRTTCFPEDL